MKNTTVSGIDKPQSLFYEHFESPSVLILPFFRRRGLSVINIGLTRATKPSFCCEPTDSVFSSPV